ncbi:MAG: hypothetical protein R3C28_11845 [Pirellulaceae bacterium]
MRRSTANANLLMIIMAMAMVLQLGCAQCKLPAIDPTGQRFLLPWPNSTNVSVCEEGHSWADCFKPQKPLFASPKTPPPCDNPLPPPNSATAINTLPVSQVVPTVPRITNGTNLDTSDKPAHELIRVLSATQAQPGQGSVTLTKKRMMAPVGSEVILVGGVCGGDGYYVTREPVEWSLEEGSVGTFLDPGNATGLLNRRPLLDGFLTEPVAELLSNKYAVSCTSKKLQVLTRGTPAATDDIFVESGQTWIGVTSSQEGESYITLVAPNLDHSALRQATAVIHWVDGQFTIPGPQSAKLGEAKTLTTQVRRTVSGQPIAGWIVRYEITGGAPAEFDGGGTVREVMTDSLGQGSVVLIPASQDSGTTNINVQVIRATNSQGMTFSPTERTVIGQGDTSVTWASSALQLRLLGPPTADTNAPVTYEMEVYNPGTAPTTNVSLHSMIPVDMEYQSSDPPGQVSGSRVDWNMGTLAPNERRVISLSLWPTRAGRVVHVVAAEGADVPPVEQQAETEISNRALFIEMFGPDPNLPLNVGDLAKYTIKIKNQSRARVENIQIADRFDEGLRHLRVEPGSNAAGPGESNSPLMWDGFGSLDPGETREIGLNFEITAPGRHCHELVASGVGTDPATVSACVTAVQPVRPNAQIRISATPQSIPVGGELEFFITVDNTGNAPLNGMVVEVLLPPELDPLSGEASDHEVTEARRLSRGARWTRRVPLAANQSTTFQLDCQALAPVNEASVVARVVAQDLAVRQQEVTVQIVREPSGGPGNGAGFDGFDNRDSNPDPGGFPNRPLDNDSFDRPSLDDNFGANSGAPGSNRNGNGSFGTVGERKSTLELVVRGRQQSANPRHAIFDVSVTNLDRFQAADSNVEVIVQLPQQVVLDRALGGYSGPTQGSVSADLRTIRLRPVRSLRQQEEGDLDLSH